MPTITPALDRDLYLDLPLSNVVVGRRPQGYIADDLLPVTPVGKQSGFYYKFYHGLNRRHVPGMSARAPGTEAKHVYHAVASDNYFCKNFALGTDWPVETQVNADEILQWSESAAGLVTDLLKVDYELRVSGVAVDTLSVSTTTLVGTSWANPSAKIFTDFETQKENFRIRTGGEQPNVAIIPQKLWQHFVANDQLRDLIFGSVNGGLVTADRFASLLGVQKILMPGAMVNTFGEMETLQNSFTYADAWGNHVWLAKVNNLAGLYTDTWLNAFRWTSDLFSVPWAVRRFPYDAKKSRYDLDVQYYQSEKVVSPDLAVRLVAVDSQQ